MDYHYHKDILVKVWLRSDNETRLKLNKLFFFGKEYNYNGIVTRKNMLKEVRKDIPHR